MAERPDTVHRPWENQRVSGTVVFEYDLSVPDRRFFTFNRNGGVAASTVLAGRPVDAD